MSRESEFRHKYGVIGAGALSKSFIGNLPRKAREIGPVAGVSFRVASRMANSLRAGFPVRDASELKNCDVILFHAPAAQSGALSAQLEEAAISWSGKPLIFCDCEISPVVVEKFRARGANTAIVRQFGVSGRIMIEGDPAALVVARRLVTALRLRAIEVEPGTSSLFAAAVTLSTAALTPLIHRATELFRAAGLRNQDAVHTATMLFGKTVHDYGYSGRQSWAWHVRGPEVEEVEAEIGALEEPFRSLFRELVLSGFEDFAKHPETALALRRFIP